MSVCRSAPAFPLTMPISSAAAMLPGRRARRRCCSDMAIMGRPPPDIAVNRHVLGDHPHVIVVPPGHWLLGEEGLPSST